MKPSILLNPYFEIVCGLILIIFSVFNLKLTPLRLIKGIIGGFLGLVSDTTAAEKEELKKGIGLPLGCWSLLVGLGLLGSGIIRLIII